MKPACRLCGSERVVPYKAVKGYALARCLSCRFVFAEDISATALEGFYEEAYFAGEVAHFASSAFDESLPPEKQWLVERYLNRPAYRRILEIGPGTSGGLVKSFLSQPEKSIECVEVSRFAADHLNAQGIPTFHGAVRDLKPKEKFNLIIATEVIEHDLHPKDFAAAVFELLEPGGLFFCTTGNIDSWMAWWQSDRWYYLDPPAHVSYFNPANLRQLLLTAGFQDVRMLNVGTAWIRELTRRNLLWAAPLISRLHLATGLLVWAQK